MQDDYVPRFPFDADTFVSTLAQFPRRKAMQPRLRYWRTRILVLSTTRSTVTGENNGTGSHCGSPFLQNCTDASLTSETTSAGG